MQCFGKNFDAWVCLNRNMNCFMSLDHAREVIGQWREEYQTIRLHSRTGGLTPDEFLIREALNFQEPAVW